MFYNMYLSNIPGYDKNFSLSLCSNLVQSFRLRHNFSFFNEVSPISSSSVLLIFGYSWGAVKNIFAQAAPQII